MKTTFKILTILLLSMASFICRSQTLQYNRFATTPDGNHVDGGTITNLQGTNIVGTLSLSSIANLITNANGASPIIKIQATGNNSVFLTAGTGFGSVFIGTAVQQDEIAVSTNGFQFNGLNGIGQFLNFYNGPQGGSTPGTNGFDYEDATGNGFHDNGNGVIYFDEPILGSLNGNAATATTSTNLPLVATLGGNPILGFGTTNPASAGTLTTNQVVQQGGNVNGEIYVPAGFTILTNASTNYWLDPNAVVTLNFTNGGNVTINNIGTYSGTISNEYFANGVTLNATVNNLVGRTLFGIGMDLQNNVQNSVNSPGTISISARSAVVQSDTIYTNGNPYEKQSFDTSPVFVVNANVITNFDLETDYNYNSAADALKENANVIHFGGWLPNGGFHVDNGSSISAPYMDCITNLVYNYTSSGYTNRELDPTFSGFQTVVIFNCGYFNGNPQGSPINMSFSLQATYAGNTYIFPSQTVFTNLGGRILFPLSPGTQCGEYFTNDIPFWNGNNYMSGNASGLTNLVMVQTTNFISGKIYTNTTTYNIALILPQQLVSASISGNLEVDLLITNKAAVPTTIYNRVGGPTIIGSLADTTYDSLVGVVPRGGTWCYTNVVSGTGNSASSDPSAPDTATYQP